MDNLVAPLGLLQGSQDIQRGWKEIDKTWNRASAPKGDQSSQGRPEPNSEITVPTKKAFVKVERVLGFSATLPTQGWV